MNKQTLVEITIYHLSIRAELAFERSQWAESLTDLAARRRLLGTRADAARDSYDQALANEFIDQYDPLIRFCAYKLGRAESHDIEGVVKDIDDEMMEEALPRIGRLVVGLREEIGADQVEAGRRTLENVEFAGEKVELRSAEMVGVMLRVQEALGSVKGKEEGGRGRGMKGWDRVLGILGEAEGVARKLLEDHEASCIFLISQPLLKLICTRLLARSRRYNPREPHNPFRSHISILSTSFSPIGSDVICFLSTPCPPRRLRFQSIPRCSRLSGVKQESRKPSRVLAGSSSCMILSCRV